MSGSTLCSKCAIQTFLFVWYSSIYLPVFSLSEPSARSLGRAEQLSGFQMINITGAGNVDGPLDVLLSENDARRLRFGLQVLRPGSLKPHRRRDEVPLLGTNRQEERDGMPHVQRRLCILRGGRRNDSPSFYKLLSLLLIMSVQHLVNHSWGV